eukprot:TRINITY_DN2016_c0_g1_i4.p2 TRINITY_DN2016_c0_g1~~TRINITY_DN2016_c0_g1_i4.p2  ORF type:complete len:116 (-),score=30.65 TRINITY_DN2016_c0_g1_i4:277-624(-)
MEEVKEKVLKLTGSIAELSVKEKNQFASCFQEKLKLPEIKIAFGEQVVAMVPHAAADSGMATKSKEKKVADKTLFNVKLEKFDTTAKIKVMKEVRAFTGFGLRRLKNWLRRHPPS